MHLYPRSLITLFRKIIYTVKGSSFGEKRFPKSYQKYVGMGAADFLHQNSVELVQVLKDQHILTGDDKIFELGSGPGRNLHYILAVYPDVQLWCSDLFKDESLKFMSEEVKRKVNFIQGDSEDIAVNNVIEGLDLLLVSDHFMHLQYNKADKIIKSIITLWKPKYILLREIKKEYEDKNHPRLFHDYDQFLGPYKQQYSTSSIQNHKYFIWLLRRSDIS